MGPSRISLLALLGTVGCTQQDAASAEGELPDEAKPHPIIPRQEAAPTAGIRAPSANERQELFPPPPPPAPAPPSAAEPSAAAPSAAAPPTSATEPNDAGTPALDYAAQHRKIFKEQTWWGKGSGIQKGGIELVGPHASGAHKQKQ